MLPLDPGSASCADTKRAKTPRAVYRARRSVRAVQRFTAGLPDANRYSCLSLVPEQYRNRVLIQATCSAVKLASDDARTTIVSWAATTGEKKPGLRPVSSARSSLGSLDVAGLLLALVAGGDIKRHLLAFLQGFEAVHVDAREMGKQVFATAIRGDEAETFGVIEPLNSTSCHDVVFLLRINNIRLAPSIVFKSHSPKSTNTDNCKTAGTADFQVLRNQTRVAVIRKGRRSVKHIVESASSEK